MSQFVAPAGPVGAREAHVEGERVACVRLGSASVNRCLECIYFLRLEFSSGRWQAPTRVVCAESEAGDDVTFAW